jgi:drug/metabolite transporter (DMT)-like permease
MPAPSRLVTSVLVALLCAVWGSTWIVIRGGLRDLPPFTSAAARFAVAALAMTVVARLLARREGGMRPAPWVWLVSGLTNFAGSYGIVYWVETRLPSGLVAVLWGVFPILMALATRWFLPGERLGRGSGVGLLIGLGGLLVLFRGDVAALGAGAVPAALVLLLSPIVSVVGTTVVKRYGSASSSVLMNRNAMWVGAGALGLLAFGTESGATPRWTPAAIASVVYLALAGTALTFGVYFWLLRYAEAHKLALIAYVTPVIALTLGWTLGDEPIRATTLLGTGMVVGGVVLVARPGRSASPK